MPAPTLADWIEIARDGGPFTSLFVILFAYFANYLMLYGLADSYLRRKGLDPLERPGYFDREAQNRVSLHLLRLPSQPGMGWKLRLSLTLNRLLVIALVVNGACILAGAIWLFIGGRL